MKIKIYLIGIFLLLSLIFIPNIIHASKPFGDGANSTNSNLGTNIEEIAKTKGDEARVNSAKFKDEAALNAALDKIFEYIRWGIAFIVAFGTITAFLILTTAWVRLANAPVSAFQRRNVYIDIAKGIIAVIGFGGLTLIMTVFYKTFSSFISHTVFMSSDWKIAFAYALVEYKYLICGATALLSLVMFSIFIKDILSFAADGASPQKRVENIKNLLITGIATIGLGGTGIFVAIFNGLLS